LAAINYSVDANGCARTPAAAGEEGR